MVTFFTTVNLLPGKSKSPHRMSKKPFGYTKDPKTGKGRSQKN